ncbi:hypothetical protein [Dokdonella sp.]|uniref:hypothetical protein n=1 Tax=Dokdonella sp. TaxID=2291710 RepID=UPI002630F460|nr:hypothetical protein [Dokdonella sp.]
MIKSQHSLCLVGADEPLQAQIAALLEEQSHRLLGRWRLAERASADLLLIDTDSVYGHMDWLREKANGRLLAACTTQADAHRDELCLTKPVHAETLAAMLNRAGARLASNAAVTTEAGAPPAAVHPVAPAEPPARVSRHPTTLLDLLEDDVATANGLVKLAAEGLPTLWLDPAARTWHAEGGLKALSGWASRTLSEDDVEHRVETGPEASQSSSAQPYARLIWLTHLVRGGGQLEAPLDAGARYKLARWPQSEREFPKHFRIATIMLKQAGTPEEIAAQSGAAIGDVADFINAYHAVGFVEVEAAAASADASTRGLFGRIKKSSTN